MDALRCKAKGNLYSGLCSQVQVLCACSIPRTANLRSSPGLELPSEVYCPCSGPCWVLGGARMQHMRGLWKAVCTGSICWVTQQLGPELRRDRSDFCRLSQHYLMFCYIQNEPAGLPTFQQSSSFVKCSFKGPRRNDNRAVNFDFSLKIFCKGVCCFCLSNLYFSQMFQNKANQSSP